MRNIVNIVNFIRGAEPRARKRDLAAPVRGQIELMKKYDLPGTFLVQYDAMIREDIAEMLLALDEEQFEIGIWLEMNQPHVEAAGLKWRGREGFEWDWHAHVGFSVGYTPEEREKLIDTIFEKFQQIFHRKVRTVGSWMIDAHSLAYMTDRYQIEASCNCKDQWGTDGYTIWGGYWNQAYYPSQRNVLSPAQSDEMQITTPVFRMLGSDPVTQYDLGMKIDEGAVALQGVESLEPVYGCSGSDPEWVDWFMRQNFTGGSLAFAYAQAGQENSFGWNAMKDGLNYQFERFAKWRAEGRLIVEKMCESGAWYKQNFVQTPATAVSSLEPFGERQAQSVWYNCKNYRANLYRDAEGLRIRDLVLFDERYEERYLRDVCTTEYLVYDNLSVIDGNRMSGEGVHAGGWLVDENGSNLSAEPMSTAEEENVLRVRSGRYGFVLSEDEIMITGGAAVELRWSACRTPYCGAEGNLLRYEYRGMKYALKVLKGGVSASERLVLLPEDGELRIALIRE